jgi:uncharacterized RDD family membrane protein YckC
MIFLMEEYNFASTNKQRAFAFLIDYAIFFIIIYFYMDLFGLEEIDENGNTKKVVRNLLALPIISFWFLLFPILEGSLNQTFGKKIIGIKVISTVRKDNFGVIEAVKRRGLDWIELNFFGLIAYFVSKNSPLHQRVGDILAKTVVVKDI